MTLHNPIPEPRQHATGWPTAVQRLLLNPQNPVFLPVQQGNGLRTSLQVALSLIAQNPVPAPVQQLSGAAPDVQAASVGGGSTLNVTSVVQKAGVFAGITSEGVKGGAGGEGAKGAVHKKSPVGLRGRGVITQGMRGGGPGVLGQVVVKVPVNDTFGSGSGAHVGSTSGRGRNLLQSSPVSKLKT
jgi:hypothetical protein